MKEDSYRYIYIYIYIYIYKVTSDGLDFSWIPDPLPSLSGLLPFHVIKILGFAYLERYTVREQRSSFLFTFMHTNTLC